MNIVIEKRIYVNRTKLSKDGITTFKPISWFIVIKDGDKILKRVLFSPVNKDDYNTLDLVSEKVFDKTTREDK